MESINVNGASPFIYKCSLNFNKMTLKKIINQLYQIEKEGLKSSSSRTFKLDKGFHSVNLLEKKYNILDRYFYIKLLISRIQEILFNEFNEKNTGIDFINNPGGLEITEIWCNILRAGDYNIPHHHQNCDISGNFYLNSFPLEKKKYDSDGCLFWIGESHNNYMIPANPKEMYANAINPQENLGILFRSWKKHIVLPHFTDYDRIGIAFNSKYNKNFNYNEIIPLPYWIPIKYSLLIDKNNYKDDNVIIKLDKSSWYDMKEYPYKDIFQKKIKNPNSKIGDIITLEPSKLSQFIKYYPNNFFNFFFELNNTNFKNFH